MKKQALTGRILDGLIQLAGTENVLLDTPTLTAYSEDETGVYTGIPEAIVKPLNTAMVSAIMAYCNTHIIAVTPRGAGTSLAGGATPSQKGVVLDMSAMNTILKIDKINRMAHVEAGVITQVLAEAVQAEGMYYPVDPASRGSSMIGGNVMTNAAGPHSFKYGSTRQYIISLTAVLANGDVIQTGSQTEKNSSGFSLTQLLCGSEGCLAIVTEIVLRLVSLPSITFAVMASFGSSREAFEAILSVRNCRADVSTLEFMEKGALDLARAYEEMDGDKDTSAAHLLMELKGNNAAEVQQRLEELGDVLDRHQPLETIVADSAEQNQLLWHLRSIIGRAVRQYSVYREVDTVVPVEALSDLLETVHAIGNRYGFQAVCYGHAGNGNLHINILRENNDDAQWDLICTDAVRKIFEFVISRGGALSGEHGIGLLNKSYMHLQYSGQTLELMRRIKAAFDPNHILNPGKVLPD